MQKKRLPLVIMFVIFISVYGVTIYFFITSDKQKPNVELNSPITNTTETATSTPEENPTFNLPTVGNHTVFTTKSDTTLRIVNEYDENFLTSNKNLLIMFASWCPNCQAEITEIEKIIKHYKNNKDVNIVLIAHEYDDTISDLINLVENNVNFGDVEVKVDLPRAIRKKIDPIASTIPISYVVDKTGKVLQVHNDSLTLEKAIDMIGK